MNIQESLAHAQLQFHFIRPEFFLLCIPALLMAYFLLHREKNNNTWQKHIDPILLTPLLQGKINAPGKKLPLMASLFWILCVIALAGPTWEKLPQPVEKRDGALVILMDLSPSMLARDVLPSRLVAAQHKIMDLLQMRKEGYTALIGYSGDAHVVSPLTDDTKTIANLLTALEPGMMPVYGSNVEDAFMLAFKLFEDSGYTQGDILLITDGISAQALKQASVLLKDKPFTLSIIGVGTKDGAPIPAGNGGFLKSKQGTIILPQLDTATLQSLANNVSGYYSALQLNNNDIEPLVLGTKFFNQSPLDKEKTKKSGREFDQWRDTGAILCILLLPFVLAAFRRGVILSLLLILPLLHTPTAQASDSNDPNKHQFSWDSFSWDSLWLNDNQRAIKAMQNKDYASAASNFNDAEWKATAQYANGDYQSALEQFQTDHSIKGLYNQANALAKSGKFSEAISSYNEALKNNPQFDDAAFNKKIVEELLKNQKKNEQQQNQDGKQGDKNDTQDKPSPEGTGNKENSAGDKKQNQNSDNKQSSDASSEKDSDENKNEQQKAHSENDKTKSDQDAKLDKGNAEQKSNGEDVDKENNGEKSNVKNQVSNKLTPEQKQALEQWLRQVPDDPSGLLRNKFEYYYQQSLQVQPNGNTEKRLNNEERW